MVRVILILFKFVKLIIYLTYLLFNFQPTENFRLNENLNSNPTVTCFCLQHSRQKTFF